MSSESEPMTVPATVRAMGNYDLFTEVADNHIRRKEIESEILRLDKERTTLQDRAEIIEREGARRLEDAEASVGVSCHNISPDYYGGLIVLPRKMVSELPLPSVSQDADATAPVSTVSAPHLDPLDTLTGHPCAGRNRSCHPSA